MSYFVQHRVLDILFRMQKHYSGGIQCFGRRKPCLKSENTKSRHNDLTDICLGNVKYEIKT